MAGQKLDSRQVKLVDSTAMIGSAANDTLDTLFPKINNELEKLFEDRNFILAEGGIVANNSTGTSVTFTASLKLHVNSLVSGASPSVIDLGSTTRAFSADGRMLYAVIDRVAATATVTADSSTLPAVTSSNQEVVLIAKRIGTSICFRNGFILAAGRTSALALNDIQYNSSATDSVTTGTATTLGAFTTGIVRLTNTSLVSLAGVPAGVSGQTLYIENKTGNAVNINNEDAGATAANRILTGTGGPATLLNNMTFSFIYDSTSSRWMLAGGTGSGSGSGGINYITYPNAEAGTQGWATYADAAGTNPVDGTGGSPSSTWTTSTSSPLRGLTSYLWTKSAANRQGEGFSYDFTIDASDKAKVLQISFDYLVSSGTYANSDMTIWIYDVTNAALIQPAGYTIQNVVGSMSQKATFQSASNSTSYRLIVHTASTSASAYTLQFDNFAVGPQIVTNGAAVTDWVSYTPTVTGFGTLASQQVQSRRVGDSLEVRGVLVTGTPTAVTASVTLGFNGINNNVTADTSKIGGGYSPNTSIGTAWEQGNTATFFGIQPILSSNTICFGSQTSTANPTTINTGSALIGSAATITFSISVPIVGWSSNVQLSSDTDTRVVAAKYIGNDSSSLSATPIVVKGGTKSFDTHGMINSVTGAITIPVSGIYEFTVEAHINALSTAANQYFNFQLRTGSTANAGTIIDTAYQRIAATSVYANMIPITFTVNCLAGEVYSFQAVSDVGASRAFQNDGFISVKRLSGPSVIAASESVNCRYGGSTTTLTNNTTVKLAFTTKTMDSHNAFSTDTYTVPVSGKYEVYVSVEMNAFAAAAASNAYQPIITKNGSTVATKVTSCMTTSSVIHAASCADVISCVAGDLIDFRFYHNMGATPTLNNTTYSNYFYIVRVGN